MKTIRHLKGLIQCAEEWAGRYLPSGIYGRAALILFAPVVLIQLVVSVSFVQRLYEDVTVQMTGNVFGDISLLLDRHSHGQDLRHEAELLGIAVLERSSPSRDAWQLVDVSGRVVAKTLHDLFPNLLAVDLRTNPSRVVLAFETTRGLITLEIPRRRVTAANPHQLLVVIVVLSILLTLLANVILRGQLRPIQILATAARAVGKGETVDFHPAGAKEMRTAGATFLLLRERIDNYVEQRKLMLTGLSHDLRTPLTRLKLGLSMNEDTPENRDLIADLDGMQALIDSFLDFLRIEAAEKLSLVHPSELIDALVHHFSQSGVQKKTNQISSPIPMLTVKKSLLETGIRKLIENALRYGDTVAVSFEMHDDRIRFVVEDDGPGIPAEYRQLAMAPFSRLDKSRNQNDGSGVGLGLPIAKGVATMHGGVLLLSSSSDLGGLRAAIEMPTDQKRNNNNPGK